MQLANRGDDTFDLVVSELQCIRNGVFAYFHRTCFNHHDRLLRGHYDDIQQARLLFGNGRVRDELAFDESDAHGGYWSRKRQIRNKRCCRGAGDSNHVWIIFTVG